MNIKELLEATHAEWIAIDETSWNERSQHPSPLVVCDFTDKQIKQAYLQGIRDAKGALPEIDPTEINYEENNYEAGKSHYRHDTLEAITRLEENV